MSDAGYISADPITPKVRTGLPKECPSQPKNRTRHTKVRCSTTKERLGLTIDKPCLTKLRRSHSNPGPLRTKDSNGQTNYIDNFLSEIFHSSAIHPIISFTYDQRFRRHFDKTARFLRRLLPVCHPRHTLRITDCAEAMLTIRWQYISIV
jgi:hypothetical protein